MWMFVLSISITPSRLSISGYKRVLYVSTLHKEVCTGLCVKWIVTSYHSNPSTTIKTVLNWKWFPMNTVGVPDYLFQYKPDSTVLSTVLSTQMVNLFSAEARSSKSAKKECCTETSGISLSPFLSPLLLVPLCKLFSWDHQQFLGEIYVTSPWRAELSQHVSVSTISRLWAHPLHPPSLFPNSGKSPRKMNTSVSRRWITEWCHAAVGSWARRGKRTSAFFWASFADTIVVLLWADKDSEMSWNTQVLALTRKLGRYGENI